MESDVDALQSDAELANEPELAAKAGRDVDHVDIGLTFGNTSSMRTEAVPTLPPKERLILELLVANGAMFGLQLVDSSKGALKRGTVYVTLGRMERKGFVESEQEPAQPGAIGLPRRLYRPTGLGERALRAWTVLANELAWGVR